MNILVKVYMVISTVCVLVLSGGFGYMIYKLRAVDNNVYIICNTVHGYDSTVANNCRLTK